MPELPEVETVRRTLINQILNKKITSVNVIYDRMLENTHKENFIHTLTGKTFKDIKRYGKYLIFIFEDCSVISHLRMEGKFFIKGLNEEISKHEHIVFTLDNEISFRYHDTRKFGKMALLNTTNLNEIMKYEPLHKLAKEANDESYSSIELYEKIKDKNIPIKAALLDQTIICGLGNIYVDEVCYLSNLHPEMPCNYLTLYDSKTILDNAKYVLEGAIKAGGTTIRSYTSSLGVTGRFQLKLHVHTKVGCACEKCSLPIKKIVVGGRGTYLCDNCQKINRPLVIGITGGIGCGKSSVSKYLTSLGYKLIDTDVISKEVASTSSFIESIKIVFGDEFIENGRLNRKKMGELIFNDKEANKKLNSLIHPIIKKKVIEEINNCNQKIVFVDVPLLYESGFDDLCHKVICVYANIDINIDRLMKRDNLTLDEAMVRINSQMDIEIKKQKAHFIIDNSLDLCYTYSQVDKVINKLLEMRK